MDVALWDQPYDDTLYGTHIEGTILDEIEPGFTNEITFSVTLTMGPEEPCPDHEDYDTPLGWTWQTEDPLTGTQSGTLCCRDPWSPCSWI